MEPERGPSLPSGSGKRSPLPVLLAGLGVLVIGAAGVVFMIGMNASSEPEETRTASEPEAEEAPKEQPAETPEEIEALEQLRRAQEALRAVAPDEVDPGEDEVPASDERVTLHFGARVASAKGKALTKGKKCDLNVHAQGGDIKDLDLSCGDVVLYDSRTPLNGMSSTGGEIFERAKGDAWVYRIAFADIGMRTSRSQLRLNSLNKQCTAFSEGSDAFQVELSLDEFSDQRVGASLLGTLPAPQALALKLHVRDKSGEPPSVPSDGCKLTSTFIENSDHGAVCKTELHCGKATLYGKGQSGFGPCEFESTSITRFVDDKETHEDGDPRLVFDVAEGSVELRDSPSHKNYSVTFEVAE